MASSSQTVKLPKASSPVSQSIPGIIRPWLWWLEPHGGRLGGDLIYMLCVPLWWPFNVEMACGCPEYLTIVLKCLNIVVQECAKPSWGHPIHILYPFRSSKPRSPPLVLGIMLKNFPFLWDGFSENYRKNPESTGWSSFNSPVKICILVVYPICRHAQIML